MKKRRADAILPNLPEATRRAIYALETEEGLTLDEIVCRLGMPECEGGFEIHVGRTALSNFLRSERTAAWRARLRDAADTAEEAANEVRATGEHVDEAIVAGLREWILDSVVNRSLDPKDAKALIGLILKSRAQDLDARKLALLERKAEQADEAEATAKDSTLTPAEREARYKEIFGIG